MILNKMVCIIWQAASQYYTSVFTNETVKIDVEALVHFSNITISGLEEALQNWSGQTLP